MNETCEVCGQPAKEQVADVAETEPVRFEGMNYRNYRLLEEHFFCAAHRRESHVTPFFASDEEEMSWMREHPVDPIKYPPLVELS